MELEITVVPVTRFVQNCMLVSAGGRFVVIDPGGDVPRILEAVAGRLVAGILVTHGHSDHVGGLAEVADATGAPVWLHPDDLWLFEDPGMGMWPAPPLPVPPRSTHIADGDVVDVAGISFRVLHTPGHTPGSVSFLHDAYLFSGDLLFAGSIGRTDFKGGDFATLVRSVDEKVWPLPDETHVLPGHGPPTTVGREKQTNPFVGEFAR